MRTITIDIDVPERYVDDLKAEVRNAVLAIRDRYICPSVYGEERCALAVGHDGPKCTNGVAAWDNPFCNEAPAAGQRVFEPGRKVRNRITGTVYVMGPVVDGNVQLHCGPSATYETAGTPFWAKYYAIADRPAEPTITVREA